MPMIVFRYLLIFLLFALPVHAGITQGTAQTALSDPLSIGSEGLTSDGAWHIAIDSSAVIVDWATAQKQPTLYISGCGSETPVFYIGSTLQVDGTDYQAEDLGSGDWLFSQTSNAAVNDIWTIAITPNTITTGTPVIFQTDPISLGTEGRASDGAFHITPESNSIVVNWSDTRKVPIIVVHGEYGIRSLKIDSTYAVRGTGYQATNLGSNKWMVSQAGNVTNSTTWEITTFDNGDQTVSLSASPTINSTPDVNISAEIDTVSHANAYNYPFQRNFLCDGSGCTYYYYDGTGTDDAVRYVAFSTDDYAMTPKDIMVDKDDTARQIIGNYEIAGAVGWGTYLRQGLYNASDNEAFEVWRADTDDNTLANRDDTYGQLRGDVFNTENFDTYPSLAIDNQSAPYGYIAANTGSAIEVLAMDGSNYASWEASATVIRATTTGAGCMVGFQSYDMGCVYSDGTDLFFKFFDKSAGTWGSEETVSADLKSETAFTAITTSRYTLVVFWIDGTDNDLYYRTRTQAGSWGTATVFASDMQTGIDNGFTASSLFNDDSEPGAVVGYWDGTDIKIKEWIEDTGTLGTGTLGSATEFVSGPTLQDTYFTSNAKTYTDFAVVYRTSDNTIRVRAKEYDLTETISDLGGIETNHFGRVGDYMGYTKPVTNGTLTVVPSIGFGHIPHAAIYDHDKERFVKDWQQIDIRYWDLHNKASFQLGNDGYVWFISGGRNNVGESHYIYIKKSPYLLADPRFDIDVDDWTDVSPTLDDGNADSVSDSCTRGYKEIFIDDNGVLFLFTESSYSIHVRAYDGTTWYDPVTVATSPELGIYWSGNGLAIGNETESQQTLHVFNSYSLAALGAGYASDVGYCKLVYQGDGTFLAYRSDGASLTLPLSPSNNDIVVRCDDAYSYSERANSTAYAEDDVRYCDGHYYICTTAGTSAGSPPTFDTDHYATTTDGTAVWTEQGHYTTDYIPVVNGSADILSSATPSLIQKFSNSSGVFQGWSFYKYSSDEWYQNEYTTDSDDAYLDNLKIYSSGLIFAVGMGAGGNNITYLVSHDEGVTWSAQSNGLSGLWGDQTTMNNFGGNSVVILSYKNVTPFLYKYQMGVLSLTTPIRVMGTGNAVYGFILQ